MPQVKELDTITMSKAEEIRRELGVTQQFMSSAVFQDQGQGWGYRFRNGKNLSIQETNRTLDVFVMLKSIKAGEVLHVIPDDNIRKKREDLKSTINTLLDQTNTPYTEAIKSLLSEL